MNYSYEEWLAEVAKSASALMGSGMPDKVTVRITDDNLEVEVTLNKNYSEEDE